jgi:hypothetical protein
MDLSDNDLTGEIPSELNQMTSIEGLQIRRNKLEGDINEVVRDLDRLSKSCAIAAVRPGNFTCTNCLITYDRLASCK